MKKYGDEQFIEMLREGQEEARNRDIRKGSVFVWEKELLFKEREIWKDRMWIWLPDDFDILGEEMVKLKYPSENRPQKIYSNPETTVNVSFSHRNEKLAKGQEAEVCNSIGQVIESLYPGCVILGRGEVEIGEGQVAWMDFITPAMDARIYNLMFFTPLKGRLLIGSCNCLEQDMEEWKELFLQMLASIRS